LSGKQKIGAKDTVSLCVRTFRSFFDYQPHILRNDTKNWSLQGTFHIINRLHTGVQVLNEERQPNSDHQTNDYPEGNIEWLVWANRSHPWLRLIHNFHHGGLGQLRINILRGNLEREHLTEPL